MYRVSVLCAVAPVVFTAVRLGLGHWEPTYDAATTVVRVRDVFSAHPPLIGFAAAPSITLDAPYSFPGALELYLLTVPVHVLGTTWGVLVGMAALNGSAIWTSLWLVRRRVGEGGAILAAAFVASLLWTLGSSLFVDPTPLQMGTLPFLCCLVAAWSVADGDGPALLVLAAVGNYLVLDQLIFTLLAPALGLVAMIFWSAQLARTRRSDPAAWSGVRRSQLRWLSIGLLFTVAVWIPPLYDQFAHPGGNLGKLFGAAFRDQSVQSSDGIHKTLAGALGVVVSVTAEPRLWLPSSFAHVPFDSRGGGSPLWSRVMFGLVLIGIVVGLWARARKHRDRTMIRALAVAAVGWWGLVATGLSSPSNLGFRSLYLAGLWPLSAFLWFTLAMTALRSSPPPWRARVWESRVKFGAAGSVVVLVLAVFAARPADHCGHRCAVLHGPQAEMARQLRAATRRSMAGRGPVQVTTFFAERSFQPSVLLGLQDAGVPFRLGGRYDVQLYGINRNAAALGDARLHLYLTSTAGVPRQGTVIAEVDYPRNRSAGRFAALDRRMRHWAASASKVEVNPAVKMPEAERRRINDALRKKVSRDGAVALLDDHDFVRFLQVFGVMDGQSVISVPGMTGSQLRKWALQKTLESGPGLRLTAIPVG